MVSTSGAMLLEDSALGAMKRLFGYAALITPNLDEASVLAGQRLKTPEDLRSAARRLHAEFGCAVLVKGGHLPGAKEAIDIFFDGHDELLLSAPFSRGVKTHGTGCTYSAAIAAGLAKGLDLSKSVIHAKEFITRAIRETVQIGSYHALGW
jgi:hydroxymethylpyrimidine/phosphomethylpyrimidine kinase